MNYKKMLLKENPKALQYLHHAHGFDFEKPFFLGSLPGRFTYKIVSDMITANIGNNFTAALLIKPAKRVSFNKLHHVTMDGGKFNIECRRDIKYWYYDIDHFFGVGDFENTRKKETDRVYIIAQNKDFLITPKNAFHIQSDIRYKMTDFRTSYDGRKNHYIQTIDLYATDGKREKVTFEPWNRFYPPEKRSDYIYDYIDKSGYILRFRRIDLKHRAIALKAQHDAERLKNTDFTEREKAAATYVTAVKLRIITMIKNAKSADDARMIDHAAIDFRYLIMDYERLDNGKFSSVEEKNSLFDNFERRAEKILNEGKQND